MLLSRATLTLDQGDFDRAEALARSSLEILEREPAAPDEDLLNAQMELAEILRRKNGLEEASALALRTRLRYAGKGESAGLARTTLLLGRIRSAQGRMEEAERELASAAEIHERIFGTANERTLIAKSALADALVIMGKADRAEPILRDIVAGAQRIYGPAHLETAITLNNLGNAISDFPEKFAESEKVYLEAATLIRAKVGPRHPELAITLNNIGALYLRMQEWEKARDAYRESVAIRVEALGPNHPDTASAQMGEALALNKLNQFSQAALLQRLAVATYTRALGADHWRTANAERYLGTVLTNLGHYDEAEGILLAAEQKLAKALGREHARTASARTALEELESARRASAKR
jgi:tetratricopeptide (TPR) repeat protein